MCMAADERAATKQEANAATESVQFDGYVLDLAWQGANPGETIKEFIPAGETLDTWTRLASIREYTELNDPQAAVGALVRQLKQKYPDSRSAIIENPTTGEVIVDFVLWPPDASFVEFNVFKYGRKPEGGMIAEQYALRAYQDQEAFLKGLRPVRERLVELMTQGLQPGNAPLEVKTGAQDE